MVICNYMKNLVETMLLSPIYYFSKAIFNVILNVPNNMRLCALAKNRY